MTATLTFDLNDFDDRQAHMRCVKALDMALVLWEIDTRLTRICDDIISRMDSDTRAAALEGIDIAMTQMRDIMHDHNINLDDLIS